MKTHLSPYPSIEIKDDRTCDADVIIKTASELRDRGDLTWARDEALSSEIERLFANWTNTSHGCLELAVSGPSFQWFSRYLNVRFRDFLNVSDTTQA